MELMNGIEILSSVEVSSIKGVLLVLLMLLVALLVISIIYISINDCDDVSGVVGLIVSLIMMPICFTFFLKESSESKTQYKVTISDEVNLNEFLDKYEIIDVDGKIYTIEEKSVDN